MASDGSGIPKEPSGKAAIIDRIVERTDKVGIPLEDILIDCVAESSAVNDKTALVTLKTMELVKGKLGINLILGTSNVSFGLPNRVIVNAVFLSLAIQAGLTCAIVDAAKMKPYVMAEDLLLGHDPKARLYTAYHRKSKSFPSH